jgi:uncharacterized membrane protein YeaQ/YmgE (transglycosylase-associated protein family)
MRKRDFQINHPSELNVLIVPRLVRKRGLGKITLSPTFNHAEKQKWETDINRYYYACGCASGAKGLMFMLVLGLAGSVIAYLLDFLSGRQLIVIPIVAAIVGAVVGKLVGLARARRRLIRVVHTVQAYWKPKDREERPIIICG